MDHQFRVADEIDECLSDLLEDRLDAEEIVAQPMHLKGVLGHRPFRIDVLVVRVSGRDMALQLDRTDLDDPVAAFRVEACRLGIKNDFTHRYLP